MTTCPILVLNMIDVYIWIFALQHITIHIRETGQQFCDMIAVSTADKPKKKRDCINLSFWILTEDRPMIDLLSGPSFDIPQFFTIEFLETFNITIFAIFIVEVSSEFAIHSFRYEVFSCPTNEKKRRTTRISLIHQLEP